MAAFTISDDSTQVSALSPFHNQQFDEEDDRFITTTVLQNQPCVTSFSHTIASNNYSSRSFTSDIYHPSTVVSNKIGFNSFSDDSKMNELDDKSCSSNWQSKQWYIILILLFFAGSSLGAIFINKTCLTGYHFRYPLTLFLLQMIFAITILTTLHICGRWDLPYAKGPELRALIFPCVLFTGNVIVGLYALSLVNIPMFSALRRLTLLFVMAAEFLLLGKKYSYDIIICVMLMGSGAFVSAVDDVSFSKIGYTLVFINNMFTAAYLAIIKRTMKETKFDPVALLYYTGLLSIPLVTSIVFYSGELKDVVSAFRTQPELCTSGFIMAITLTACGAFAVNVSTSLCTHITSPLTTSVTGQVKNVLQTLLGMFSWGFVPTVTNLGGLIVALCAQLWFGYLKFLERESEQVVIENEESSQVSWMQQEEMKVEIPKRCMSQYLNGSDEDDRSTSCSSWEEIESDIEECTALSSNFHENELDR